MKEKRSFPAREKKKGSSRSQWPSHVLDLNKKKGHRKKRQDRGFSDGEKGGQSRF